jgi:hypothetical protein
MKTSTMQGKFEIKAINGYTRKYSSEYFSITEVIECPVCHKHYVERPRFKGMVDGTCGGTNPLYENYRKLCGNDACETQYLNDHPYMFN